MVYDKGLPTGLNDDAGRVQCTGGADMRCSAFQFDGAHCTCLECSICLRCISGELTQGAGKMTSQPPAMTRIRCRGPTRASWPHLSTASTARRRTRDTLFFVSWKATQEGPRLQSMLENATRYNRRRVLVCIYRGNGFLQEKMAARHRGARSSRCRNTANTLPDFHFFFKMFS
jgi:hypothetical protein